MPTNLSVQRLWIVHFIAASLFLIVGYQLVQLCMIRQPSLVRLAEKQHRLSIEIPPMRGQILDRHGKELATDLKVPSVYAVPRLLRASDRPAIATKVSRILGLDRDFVLDRLSRNKAFIWLKRRIPFDEAGKIRSLELASLGIVEEYRRFYPQGDLLSQILGFTDVDSRGLEGVELSLNQELQGRAGRRITRRDAMGREIRAYEIKTIPSVDGNRVWLTIDQYLQYLTERALDRAYHKWKAKGAIAVIMDPHTGKILAMANRPNFDPNAYEKSAAQTRRNRAISDMYEPGSVFKIVTASAALNENTVTAASQFNCENGRYRYGSKVLHDVHSYGMLSLEEVIVKSSNIGAVKIAATLRPGVFYRYIKAFGFGEPTGIDLGGEAPGFVRAPAQWSKTSPFNIPMGQEIMVTALQMTAAMAVIANGGNLMKPYAVERIEDQAGVVLAEKKPAVKRQVIRPEIAALMRHILVRVVEEGTGKLAKIDGIAVGGKTGTAQKILPNGRGYSHNNFMSSFVGFAPADNPQFVMAVVLDDPKPRYFGGTVAAPVFKEVMETALFTMGYVPPSASAAVRARQDVPARPPILQPLQAAGTKPLPR